MPRKEYKPMFKQFRIEVIKVVDLDNFIKDFKKHSAEQNISPISRQRAVAMMNNPFADLNDPGLIIAYDDQRIVGYLGLLPGILWASEKSIKVLWGSALFVDPGYRDGIVFLTLVRTALSFGLPYIITGFTKDVYNICKALRFRELKSFDTCGINISKLNLFEALLWRARKRRTITEATWKRLSSFAAAARLPLYFPLRALYLQWLRRKALKELKGITFREVEQVRLEAEVRPKAPHFVRGVAAVNWMQEHPLDYQSDSRC
jgi:hypothetical protein